MNMRIAACFMAVMLIAVALTGCDLPFASPGQSAPPSTDQAQSPPLEQKSPDIPVVLYLPNDNADGFKTKAALTDGSAEHIISLLVSEKALPEGCALLSFDKDGRGGTADMNAAYLKAISEGTTAEYLRLGCVVNTLLPYFELEKITLTVEGKTPETGQEVYDYPLRFYKDQIADLGSETTTAPGEYNENDLSDMVAVLPRSDAVDIIWSRLGGYWNATDNLFVVFLFQDGIPGFAYGMWESEYASGFGELISADPMSDYEAALTFRFPAIEANEVAEAREESTVTVFLDVRGLDQDGKINIKVDGFGDGSYYTYAYGGANSEEAYQSIHR